MTFSLIVIKIKSVWFSFISRLKDEATLTYYVAYLTVTGLLFFAFALINNLFTVPLSGDYVLQQIPFYLNGYDDWWHFLTTGEFPLWDSSTYLGSNNIGSNAFYYLTNPFFLPILLFPRFLVPQGLAVLMIMKMVLAGLAFRAYLKYLGVSEKTARLFGLVYAFAGWNVYYLWFNHFMEVTIVFPLILLGIEKLLREKNYLLLSFALFLMGITNFFFLISSAFAGVLYAIYRYFDTLSKRSWQDSVIIGPLGILAFAVGIGLSMMVFLPAVMVAVTSNRVDSAFYLPTLLGYWDTQNYEAFIDYLLIWRNSSGQEVSHEKLYPLISFLFPTVSNRSSTLLRTGYYDNTVSSLFIYTPIMLLLIPSMIQSLKKLKFFHFVAIGFLALALFTPFFYNLFHGFTVDYGRWQIFVVASMVAYIAVNYDQRLEFKRWYFDVSFLIIFGAAVWVFFEASTYQNTFGFTGLEERLYVGIAALAYMIYAYLYLRVHGRRDVYTAYLMNAITIEAAVMGTLIANMHGLTNYIRDYDNGLELVNDQQQIVERIQRDDDDLFRMYNLNANESSNIGMRLGYNGMTAFHSLYNFHVMEFNEWSHMNYNHEGWSMGYHEKRYNLDAFLNVKYYLIRNRFDTFSGAILNEETGKLEYPYHNVPLGFVKEEQYSTSLNTVYRNTNFIEGGFSFPSLIRTNYNPVTKRSDFYNNTTTEVLQNEEAYLQGAILRNDDIEAIIEQYPEFEVTNVPPRNIDRIATRVTVITCDDYIKERENFTDYTDCDSPQTISLNSSISNYESERSGIFVSPLSGNHFGNDPLGYFFAMQLRLSYHATVYFLDEQGNVIVRDAHSKINTSFKFMRGYYADVPVAKILIVPQSNYGSIPFPAVYQEPYGDYLSRLNALNDFPLLNFSHTYNTLRFKTNDPMRRFIVLSTPYDPGWRVTLTHEDGTRETRQVYKAQGGFIGFVSESGNINYKIEYITPYLPEGVGISLVSFTVFAGSFLVYRFLKQRSKRKNEFVDKDANHDTIN
jgi:uncharacterized membrane protein YfhO